MSLVHVVRVSLGYAALVFFFSKLLKVESNSLSGKHLSVFKNICKDFLGP